MAGWQKFPISNFRAGLNEALEPWLLPRDAFPSLRNAHLYRGVIEKVPGYSLYARFSYRRTNLPAQPIDGVRVTFTGTMTPRPSTSNIVVQAAIDPGGINREIFTYVSDGTSPVINLASNLGGTGTVNMATGDYSVTFNTAPAVIPGGYNAVIVSYDFLSSAVNKDIMGIKPWYGADGSQGIIVFDTRRASKVITLTGVAAERANRDYGTTELPHESAESDAVLAPAIDGIATVFTGTASGPLVPGTVKFVLYDTNLDSVTVITDNGAGLLTGVAGTSGAPLTATGFINYFTGAYTLTFSGPPLVGQKLYTSVCIYGDYFTGGFSNFFSTCNYQNLLFMTNNIDNVRYYDGACVKLLYINFDGNPYNTSFDITRCLHVAINRERLLLLAPTVQGAPQLNSIYWSKAGFPLDFSDEEFLPAPTSEAIRLFSFVNSDMVVRFAASERVFRYTGDAFSPFRWDTTNSLWRCDTQYSAINYDSWFSSVCKDAIVGSDGVNVQRADSVIPDFTMENRAQLEGQVVSISQTSIGQCYGERFDDFKEGWLCFKESTADQGSTAERSDTVLAFNYLDNTYAIYDFPFNCLGFGRITAVNNWGNNYDLWGDADYTWDSVFEQSDALVSLAGDRQGNIFVLGNSNITYTSNGQPQAYYFDVTSKNFNPFIEDGELCRFGYIDLLVSASQLTKLRVQFYADDNLYIAPDGNPAGYYQETTIVFTPTDSMSSNAQTKVWKRIYVGAVARFHTIRFYQSAADFTADTLAQPVRIHSMVLYMKPAGRVFN